MGDSATIKKLTTPDEIIEFLRTDVYAALVGHPMSEANRKTSLPRSSMPDYAPEWLRTHLHNLPKVDDTLWHIREAARFSSKDYIAVKYNSKTTADTKLQQALYANLSHYVHMSKDAPGYIAYTPDETHGKQDRRVKTTVGRYLKKFFPTLSDTEIRELTDAFRNRFGLEDVKIARTVEEITKVYINGPNSCMSKNHDDSLSSRDQYGSHVHPAAIYAYPGVAVAYLERANKINSRAVIFENPDDSADRRFIRVYGDEVLRLKLEAMGFKQGSLVGAKLAKIIARRTDNAVLHDTYVTPYIDDMAGTGAYSLKVMDDHMLVTNARPTESSYKVVEGRSQNGLTGKHRQYTRSHGASWNVDRLEFIDADGNISRRKLVCLDCASTVEDDGNTKYKAVNPAGTEHVCPKCIKHWRQVYGISGKPELARDTTETIAVHGLEHPVLKNDDVMIALRVASLSSKYYTDIYGVKSNVISTADGHVILTKDAVRGMDDKVYHRDEVIVSAAGFKIIKSKKLHENTNVCIHLKDHYLLRRESESIVSMPLQQFYDSLAIRFAPTQRRKVFDETFAYETTSLRDHLFSQYEEYIKQAHPQLINKAAQGSLILEEETS